MAETYDKDAIASGDEETRGQKRVNEDKDTGLAKMAEVVGKGEGMQEEEQEVNDNVKRLRALLEDDPRNVIYKKADEAIRYLKATDIINWASSSNKVEEMAMEEYGYLEEDTDKFVPSFEKVDRLMRLMLVRGIDELEAVDLYILYNNFPKSGFTSMLLHALDSYSERRLKSGQSVYPKDMRSSILKACPVLCWKLFAHVMYELTSLSVFSYSVSTATTGTSEEKGMQKKAAENCIICSGSGKHGGVYGDYCSYWEYVPSGVTVGSTHVVHCRDCYEVGRHGRKFVRCTCGSREGVAVPRGLWWDSDIYNNNEDQSTPG